MLRNAPCPIPEVDRALSSYIHSREETLKIRRTLTRYLTSSLRPVDNSTANQHLNHECPHFITAANTNPPGLQGLRLEYLNALRARSKAQLKHRQLQASLAALHSQHVDATPFQKDAPQDDGTQAYIALLRQRRRLAELQVIQDALDKLLTARPAEIAQDPKQLIDESLGAQPSLPAERLEILSEPPTDQSSIFKIKQEVLDARARLDAANAAKQAAHAAHSDSSTLPQQVHALGRARDEIAEWVHHELAKMEEDSVFLEDASPMKRHPDPSTAPVDPAAAEAQIKDAYDRYVASRARLLASHTALHHPTPTAPPKESPPAPTTTSESPHPHPTATLLPHLQHLQAYTTTSHALLTHSLYLSSRLAAAAQGSRDALLRLSGESHLVPAGSGDVAAWKAAVEEADSAAAEVVRGSLARGREGVEGVERVLGGRGAWEAVLGGV